MNVNFQPGIHPDADQLSVFVEGGATAREEERMLAHMAECAECRKAVFLMQPHEEPQPAAITPEKRWAWRGWTWRWLVPVGVPAAALACAVMVVLIYIRPHGGRPGTPQQIASVKPPENERPRTEVAPTSSAEPNRAAPTTNSEQGAPATKSEQAPAANSELLARSEGRRDSFATSAPAKKAVRQESPIAGGSNLPELKSGQATASAASPTAGAAPSIAGGPVAPVQTTDSTLAQNTVSTSATSNLPLNGRNFAQLQQLQPLDKGAASQNTLAKEKELPALQIQTASAQDETLAGISGRVTDRSGAVIAGVTVTLRDTAGNTRQTTTATDGSFHLTELPAGQYELTATATGFKTSEQSIELKPSELAMLQPVLDVGAVTETVEVEAGTVSLQTESASIVRVIAVPSGLPVASTVSHGKRLLSLDSAGNLFMSRNEGKKWKKVKPQWAGKAIRIELTSGSVSEDAQKPKGEASVTAGEGAVFSLTTDGGAVWSSKDGARWHQQ